MSHTEAKLPEGVTLSENGLGCTTADSATIDAVDNSIILGNAVSQATVNLGAKRFTTLAPEMLGEITTDDNTTRKPCQFDRDFVLLTNTSSGEATTTAPIDHIISGKAAFNAEANRLAESGINLYQSLYINSVGSSHFSDSKIDEARQQEIAGQFARFNHPAVEPVLLMKDNTVVAQIRILIHTNAEGSKVAYLSDELINETVAKERGTAADAEANPIYAEILKTLIRQATQRAKELGCELCFMRFAGDDGDATAENTTPFNNRLAMYKAAAPVDESKRVTVFHGRPSDALAHIRAIIMKHALSQLESFMTSVKPAASGTASALGHAGATTEAGIKVAEDGATLG